jgi:putative ABC transport system permease protein
MGSWFIVSDLSCKLLLPGRTFRHRLVFAGGIFMNTLLLDLRCAVRSFAKERRFAFLAILALALGIASSTVVFSVFYNLLFNAFDAKDASRLAVPSIQSAQQTQVSGVELLPLLSSFEEFNAIREQNHVFEDMAGYAHAFAIFSDGREIHQLYDGIVTANAFDFYGVPALLGRGIVVADGSSKAPPVFVVGYNTWKNEFNADTNIIGRTFTVNGERTTCVGVMPPRFQAYGATVQAWLPFKQTTAGGADHQQISFYSLARLKPGVSLAAATVDLELILKRMARVHPDRFPEHFTARVQSATDLLMGPWGIGSAGGAESTHFGVKSMLYDLFGAAMMLLFIACCNVANLLLARATGREKEIAIRASLGASPTQLLRLLLVESFVLAACACIAGCALAWFGMKGAAAMIPHKGIGAGGEAVIALNGTVLIFALVVTVVTALVCGLAPALHAIGGDLRSRLSGVSQGNGRFRHGRLRSSLVIGEVALSIVLLIGAGLMIRSFFALTHVDLGFDPGHLLWAVVGPPPNHHPGPDQGNAFLPRALKGIETVPGVLDVAINNSLPGYNPGWRREIMVPGTTHSEQAGLDGCSESLLRTLGLHVARGRWLSRSDVDSAQHVAVLNATMAIHFFGNEDPVGRQITAKAFDQTAQPPRDANFQVIGVVDDTKDFGPQVAVIAMAYIPHTLRPGGILFIRTKTNPASLMHAVQQQIWAIDREAILAKFGPYRDTFDELTYSAPELGVKSLGWLASIALLLVVVGVFSVMAYTVSLQTHDIGVRMALGAQQHDILRMVLKNGAILISSGIVLGVLVSFGLTRLLSSEIWGIPANDPWTFTAAALCIVFAGLAACFVPARRASQVDPLIALRCE